MIALCTFLQTVDVVDGMRQGDFNVMMSRFGFEKNPAPENGQTNEEL